MNSFVIILAACTTVTYAAKLDWRIVGGNLAADGQFPYQVSLRRNGRHSCGGSILNENWILTAAHCLKQISGKLTVVTGSNLISSGGDEYDIITEIYDPSNPDVHFDNDIGLIKVSTPIQFNDKVQPIAVNTEFIGAGKNMTVSGWGTTTHPGTTPDELRFIHLTSISNSDCSERHDFPIARTELCTYTKVGEGICTGDSGGALTYDSKVAGIVNWLVPCGVGYPDVFTRVSEFINWIEETMATN